MSEKLSGEEWLQSARRRRIDVAFASVALPVVLPVIAGAAVAFFAENRENPIFRQTRVGKAQEPFTILKLRTMPGSRDFNDASFGANDPRASKIGKLLRTTSLDEWPQIYNILHGDMSVVGPRPLIESEMVATMSVLSKRQATEWEMARKALRPGWYSRFGTLASQLVPQTTEYYRTRAELDCAYIRQASPNEDLQIIRGHYKNPQATGLALVE